MTKLVLNPSLQAIRGRIAGFVYRLIDGKLTVSKAPDMSGVKWSPAQVAHRKRFRLAVAHARNVMRDEKLRAAYEKKTAKRGKRLFNQLVSDYFKQTG